MIVSAPIPHLAIIMSLEFKDSNNTKDCIDLLEGIETSDVKTGLYQVDDRFVEFTTSLKNNDELKYFCSSFLAFYFSKREMNELYEKFVILTNEYGVQKPSDFKNLAYIGGLFTSALMNDLQFKHKSKNQSIPEHIEQAVKYLESENFTVYIEKNE